MSMHTWFRPVIGIPLQAEKVLSVHHFSPYWPILTLSRKKKREFEVRQTWTHKPNQVQVASYVLPYPPIRMCIFQGKQCQYGLTGGRNLIIPKAS